MINVLKNWSQIGEATHFLDRNSLPRHLTPEKNWDLAELSKLAYPLPRNANLIDLGCGDLYTLKLLNAMGFKNLWGVDLSLKLQHRAKQIKHMFQNKSIRPQYKLYRRDICETNFPNSMFTAATCISVLEHGIVLEDFFTEAYRILAPDGLLFITVDYWEETIVIHPAITAFNKSWKIFSKNDINDLLTLAFQKGFKLFKEMRIPTCERHCVIWNKKEYTFLKIVLQKR